MDLMLRRRGMMLAGKKSRLPSAYKEVEYLHCTRGQYIDTGYIPNVSTIWELVCRATDADFYIGGGGSPRTGRHGDGQRFSIYIFNNVVEIAIGSFKQIPMGFSIKDKTLYAVLNATNRKGSVYLNNELIYDESFDITPYTNQQTLFLFARHVEPFNVYADDVGCLNQDIFSSIITENGVDIQRLIPCYRKEDSKPGMYDLAGSICPLTNSPFYINAGVGEFLVGPDVN